MAILKCKMCGGDLSLVEGESTAKCEYCGSVQTVPKTDDEKKLVLFERAERLRRLCEFDKAAGIYEAIVADFRQEAEAYWGLVLCKYGIEYVDDPATAKKIPTCHRSSFESIMEDGDFEQALENADTTARGVYRKEAKQIEEIRKGIIAVSANEEPYDIFICYKETDEKGERTLDSVLAQDVYDALTDKGYRVFFSRITLEDKLGVEYEPYIFAALNSAKIMLAFGTDYEYFNAVWVKNEWSRFLKLMTKDKEKHLIPCYKGIDAYDMPKAFTKLQAQDMGKVGAMQDLLRGIAKILPLQAETSKKTDLSLESGNASVAPLLKRGNMALEDGEWENADRFFEGVLNLDPECSEAYLGKVLAAKKMVTLEQYIEQRLQSMAKLKKTSEHYPTDLGRKLQAHVEEMVKQYAIMGRLSADEIAAFYTDAPVSGISCAEEWSIQLQEEKQFWQETKLLVRAVQYDKTGRIEELKTKLLTEMQKQSEEARITERNEAKCLADVYQQFVAAADAAVIEKYEQLKQTRKKTKADVYATAKLLLQNGNTSYHIQLAKKMFNNILDYEDSIQMVEECDKKQKSIQERMKRNESLNRELLTIRKALKENTGFFGRKERERLQKREKEIMMQLDPYSII